MNSEIDAISQAGRSGNILRILPWILFSKYVGYTRLMSSKKLSVP